MPVWGSQYRWGSCGVGIYERAAFYDFAKNPIFEELFSMGRYWACEWWGMCNNICKILNYPWCWALFLVGFVSERCCCSGRAIILRISFGCNPRLMGMAFFLLNTVWAESCVRYSWAWAWCCSFWLLLCFAFSFFWHRYQWGWNLLLDANCLFVANFVVF